MTFVQFKQHSLVYIPCSEIRVITIFMAKLAFRIWHLSFGEVIYGSASSDVIKGYLDVLSSALHVKF